MSIKSTGFSSLAGQNRFPIKAENLPLIKDRPSLADDDHALLHFYYDLILGRAGQLEPGRWPLFQEETFHFLRDLFERCEPPSPGTPLTSWNPQSKMAARPRRQVSNRANRSG